MKKDSYINNNYIRHFVLQYKRGSLSIFEKIKSQTTSKSPFFSHLAEFLSPLQHFPEAFAADDPGGVCGNIVREKRAGDRSFPDGGDAIFGGTIKF